MGYKFQFVTLAGFHSLNAGMFELAQGYRDEGMAAFSHLQEREFAMEQSGFTAVRHQSFVGAGYFDAVQLPPRKHSSRPRWHSLRRIMQAKRVGHVG